MGAIELICAFSALFLGWLGFLEKRLHTMQSDIEHYVDERNRLNEERNTERKAEQAELKDDIIRLETKIDKLLKIVYSK